MKISNRTALWLNCYENKVTVQPAPFVKPHFVLIAAAAAVLLIYGAQLIGLHDRKIMRA